MPDDQELLRRFEALVRASPGFVALASLDETVEFLNDAGRELVGMPPETDVLSTSISDYMTEEGLLAAWSSRSPRWPGTAATRARPRCVTGAAAPRSRCR